MRKSALHKNYSNIGENLGHHEKLIKSIYWNPESELKDKTTNQDFKKYGVFVTCVKEHVRQWIPSNKFMQ